MASISRYLKIKMQFSMTCISSLIISISVRNFSVRSGSSIGEIQITLQLRPQLLQRCCPPFYSWKNFKSPPIFEGLSQLASRLLSAVPRPDGLEARAGYLVMLRMPTARFEFLEESLKCTPGRPNGQARRPRSVCGFSARSADYTSSVRRLDRAC